MKTVSKKLFSLLLVAILLISAVPFQAFADPSDYCQDLTHGSGYEDKGDGAKHAIKCADPSCPKTGTWIYKSGENHDLTVTDNGDGTHSSTCSKCTYATTGEAHTISTYTVTKEPTCVLDGEKTGTCSACGAVVTSPVPATGAHKDLDTDGECDYCHGPMAPAKKTPTGELTLDDTAGTGYVCKMPVVKGEYLNYLESVSSKVPPEREGYKFDGWYVDHIGNPLKDTTLWTYEGDQTAYAKWTKLEKQLKIYLEFTDGSKPTQLIHTAPVTESASLLQYLMFNSEVQTHITDAKNSNPGYDYEYYYDFTGKQGLIQQDTKMDEARTVYIKFAPKTFKLIFQAVEAGATVGTEVSNPKTVTFNKIVGTLPTAKLAGKVFVGWKDTKHNEIYSADTKFVRNEDIVLTAQFSDTTPVVLHVYMNGNTTDAVLNEVMYGYAKYNFLTKTYDSVTRDDVAKFLSGKVKPLSGNSVTIDGLFDKDTWPDYVRNTNKTGAPLIQVNDYVDGDQHPVDIYVMVRNAQFGSYISKKPYDPSNPKTGDEVMLEAAAGIMALAAVGFVAVTIARKKKAM